MICRFFLSYLLIVIGSAVSSKVYKDDKCKETFPAFMGCLKKKLQITRIESELEAELSADFEKLTEKCFVNSRSVQKSNLCSFDLTQSSKLLRTAGPLTRAVYQNLTSVFERPVKDQKCIRSKLYNTFPEFILQCYKSEMNDPLAIPEALPDIDGSSENLSSAFEKTYASRMNAYVSIANCARKSFSQARSTTACMARSLPRMYNRHCVKLMAGCLQNSLTITGLPCINQFDKIKKGMCACAIMHRKKIMANMIEIDKLFQRNLSKSQCKLKLTEALATYVPSVETAFQACLGTSDFILRVRMAIVAACDANPSKREDSIQAVYYILSFFQSTIDRFDRFCQSNCPHQLLIDYMKQAPG